jgi:putative hydrolase of the HAD superfamily
MVLVFDLDDTLFEEITFVKSGFDAVAAFLFKEFGVNQKKSLAFMLNELQEEGRGKIFNELLIRNNLFSKSLLKKCLSVYRLHKPNICLYPDAIDFLLRTNYSKYIVTDGNKIVQKNKIHALGLHNMVKKAMASHHYGIKNAKPSAYCFLKISEWEKTSPEKIIYFGDNPNKDFVGIKPLGFKTVRVMRGNYAKVEKPKKYEADYRISSFAEITEEFLLKITK